MLLCPGVSSSGHQRDRSRRPGRTLLRRPALIRRLLLAERSCIVATGRITRRRRPGMSRWLPSGNSAVVTRRTSPGNHTGMTKARSRPCRRRPVTQIARLGGRKMVYRLASGRRAVMAGRTGAGSYACVIHGGRNPGRGPVTGIASRRGRNMARRFASRR